MKLKETSQNLIYSKQKEVSKELKNCLTNTKKQNGITLIALVVTIIVLLILAGVSINMVLGNNGIFSKAQESKTTMEKAVLKDKIETLIVNWKADNIIDSSVTVERFWKDLEEADIIDDANEVGEPVSTETVDGVKKEIYEIETTDGYIVDIIVTTESDGEVNISIGNVILNTSKEPKIYISLDANEASITVKATVRRLNDGKITYLYREQGTTNWTEIKKDTTDLTTEVTGIVAGKTYEFKASVINSEGSDETEIKTIKLGSSVESITLNKTSASIAEGSTLQLSATVSPENATNKEIEWTSSNESVATVDQNGKVTTLAEGSATITAKAKDGSGVKAECSITVEPIVVTTPYLPDSTYSYVDGTSIDTGLVVKDKSGNQYVWVEVPKTTEVYSTAGLNITNFTSEEYVQIENDLHTYTNYYRESARNDIYYSDATTGLTSEQYTQLKQKMLKSVYENGGFWVARYEAGIETNRTTSGTPTVAPISKANVYPYNYVTCSQAQTLANKLTTSDYTSSLMFGVQWDLVLKFIEVKSVAKGTALATIQSELMSNSKSWGNYNDNLWTISSTLAKYSTDSGKTFTSTPYTKTSSASVLLTTGASESFSKMNISDLAGNELEWTLEYTASTSSPCAIRGGLYGYYGSNSPASYRGYGTTSYSDLIIGFRVALYK